MRSRRVLRVVLSLAAALLVAVGAIGFLTTRERTSTTATATDMRGHHVQLDTGEIPVPAASSKAVTDTGARLRVPSVGLDVPLGALNAVNGQITPPGFTSAYWVRNLGVPVTESTTGTVFVVMHSLRGGGIAPGNYLTNITAGTSKVKNGAQVEISGTTYTVTGSQLVTKTRIADNAAVWANTPGRLLLITCLEHPNGTPSTDNLVITATTNYTQPTPPIN